MLDRRCCLLRRLERRWRAGRSLDAFAEHVLVLVDTEVLTGTSTMTRWFGMIRMNVQQHDRAVGAANANQEVVSAKSVSVKATNQ